MSEIAVRVEGLSKQYGIGVKRFDTLRDQLVHGLRPWRWRAEQASRPSSTFWALRDVSFDVADGQVIGIVGRNGAGKSTLLKILSRITDPTAGRVEIRGRVGSLLEVGTGFHPELTGRENIYLNAAILGMRRMEVGRKFDEIVEFSGVERFIDTPVKRYSSGMYVRLAFAVAAHLEPEILIVDEVLSVGDATFQRKCLGKMEDVTHSGRTVLLVSHNLATIEKICHQAILLRNGMMVECGPAPAVVEAYAREMLTLGRAPLLERTDRMGAGEIIVSDLELLDGKGNPTDSAICGQETIFRLHYTSKVNTVFTRARACLIVYGNAERPYFLLSTDLVDQRQLDLEGDGFIDFIVPELPLSNGTYHLTALIQTNWLNQDIIEYAAQVTVIDGDFYGTGKIYPPGWQGATVLVPHRWALGQQPACKTRR